MVGLDRLVLRILVLKNFGFKRFWFLEFWSHVDTTTVFKHRVLNLYEYFELA